MPEAVRDTRQILAEIAVERAKAEAAHVFKDKLVAKLCDALTIGKVLRSALDPNQRLLPSTCGQLENLRISCQWR